MVERRKIEKEEPVREDNSKKKALINRYRPQTFKEVVGHKAQVKALMEAVDKGLAHTFLFTGPGGVGKTSLARIVAAEVGVAPENLLDIDAATYTGIDEMRRVQEHTKYRPLSGGVKGIVVDEVHGLSKQAINSLLKATEEPEEWVYWFFCTTEPGRLPTTMKTRCLHTDLKPVGERDLTDLLEMIVEKEGFEATEDVVDVCVEAADGSPRQAISNLAVCSSFESGDEAREVLQKNIDEAEAVELARLLMKNAPWKDVQGFLRKFQGDPESARHVVRGYVTKVTISVPKQDVAGRGMEILDAFSQPFNRGDGISPLVLACGKATLQ